MDRNEKFRKRLEQRLENKQNQLSQKALSVPKRHFDPTPYVEIIFDKMAEEDEDTINIFMDNLYDNPDLTVIFGDASLLSNSQKSEVMEELMQRISTAQTFDREPYVKELIAVFGTSDFDKYEKIDKNGKKQYDFDSFLDKYDLKREQKSVIIELFYKRHRERGREFKRVLSIPFLMCLLLVIIPPFFIPNFLQKIGWLSSDVGWLTKILVGIISAGVLFFVAKTFFIKFIIHTIRKKNI